MALHRFVAAVWLSLGLVAGAACSGGSDGDSSVDSVGDDQMTVGDLASQDSLGQDDSVAGEDVVGSDAVNDSNPALEGVLAFRLETRFGTTEEWKGVTTLGPSGLVHSENDGGEACEKQAEDRYLEQFAEAVAAADVFNWPEDVTGTDMGNCASDTFLLVFSIQSLGTGHDRTIRFCENNTAELPGAEDVLTVIAKLSADARQNGVCGKNPFILGRPIPVEAIGYDDGLQHVLGVASFEDPTYCMVVYAAYNPEVYQSTLVVGVDGDYVSEMLSLYVPAQESDPFFTPLKSFCPAAEPLIQNAEFISDLSPSAAVFLAWEEAGELQVWMAVTGVLGVEQFSPATDEQPERPMVFNINSMEFHPIRNFSSSPSLSWDPWSFVWLASSMFETPSLGAPGE